MASMIGEMTVTAGGKKYNLRLGILGFAKLQDDYGRALEPIIGIKVGELPHFGVFLRVVEIALEKHHPDEANLETAELIMSENMSVAVDLVHCAFPTVDPETAKSLGVEPGKKKRAASRR